MLHLTQKKYFILILTPSVILLKIKVIIIYSTHPQAILGVLYCI